MLKPSGLFVGVNVFIGLIDLLLDLIMLILGRLLEEEGLELHKDTLD